MIIRYSLINAIVLFNLAMVAVALLRHKTGYLARYTTSALLALLILSTVRVFIPISIPYVTFIIRSYEVIPRIESFLRFDLLPWDGRLEVQSVILIIWGIGIVIMGLKTANNMRRLHFMQRSYQVIDSTRENKFAQSLGMKHATITVSPNVSVPYITGVFKAKIFLPPLGLPDEKLEMVLRHEYQHFKSGDAIIKLLYLILSIMFWLNPSIHFFLRDLDCLLEIRCDAVMSKRMTRDEKKVYLETLLEIYLSTCSDFSPAAASALFRGDNKKLIIQRFKLLTSERTSFRRQAISVMVVVFLFLASFLFIIQPYNQLPQEYMNGVFILSPDNAVIVLSLDGIYRLYIDGIFFYELPEITAPFAGIPIIYEEG
ncbi:MAG: M56 family metallopeptidase [Oscillospiraceae bacterium]|nr:M56 family metallopeptidase [Oscillospiraceae bacterium]MCL2278451.1 M56 family metallopeptidase [Oscillospiraceae bacterium]